MIKKRAVISHLCKCDYSVCGFFLQAGNHCWLCGKNCNSEKQWQQHITSEKHKDRVFNSEDDQNCWQYRFPTGTFKVCERWDYESQNAACLRILGCFRRLFLTVDLVFLAGSSKARAQRMTCVSWHTGIRN